MNVKKMFFSCLTILGIVTAQMLHAQSTIPQRDLWVIGQNVVSFDPVLGTLTTVNQLPIHSSTGVGPYYWPAPNPTTMYLNNSYHDESGSLLFYIADGKVYDFEGRYIGTLNTSAGTTVYGYKDIAIVPDKCNPSVFYIVAIIDRANGHNGQSSSPLFAKLEIGLDINANTFDNQQNAGFSGDPLADGRLGFAASNYASGTGFPEMLPLLNNNTGWQNEPMFTFAVSKRQADGEYLLFTSSGNETAIIKGSDLAVAGNSNTFPATLYTSVGFGNQNPNSECELYQQIVSNDNTNVIRIANSSALNIGYFYQDFTYVAGAITASPMVLLNDVLTNNAGNWIPHGLEFSKLGQYLYFTTSRVVTPFPPTYEYRLNYFDLSLANPVSQNITNTQLNYNIVNSFLNSQIELGKDGGMYFWNGTQLGQLMNTDFPTSIVPANFTTVNLPIADQTNFDLLIGDTRMMNDQVDGEPPYTPFVVNNSPEDKQCCIDQKRYTKVNYTVLEHTVQETGQIWTKNQVWSPGSNPFNNTTGHVSIKDRLIIPAGYTVTINNMTFEYKIFINDPDPSNVNNIGAFVDGAKCVLEAPQTNVSGNIITLNGGTLILNNTIFKSIYACEGMWDGIEVQGSPNAPQQVITSGPLNIKTQARLIVNAGSIIQDAYFGAANYAFDLTNGDFANNFKTPTLQSGGIIIGTANSTFKNNRVGVCFMPYFTGNVVSNFKNTSFLIDAPLKDPLITPHAMALLNEIKVMNFKSCTFLNSATNDYPIVPVAPAPVILHGILANSSSFSIGSSVLAATIPYGSGCSFTNLTYGIKAFNATVNTALVQSSNFYNNYRGSYFANYSGSSTTVTQRNRYFVYEYPTGTPANDAAYGHYLNYCNNFKVQENRFYYNSYNETTGALVANKYNAYGCIINEENPEQTCATAGYRGDEVYKNLFKEINIGAQAQGFNSEEPKRLSDQKNPCYTGGTNNPNTENNVGLKYTCNTFSGTDENDITVMQDAAPLLPVGSLANPGRISYQQGSATQPAGNVFSHITTPFNCGALNLTSERELYIDKTGIYNNNQNALAYVSNNATAQRLYCFSPLTFVPNITPLSSMDNTGILNSAVNSVYLCPSRVGAITRGSVLLTADYNNLIPLIKNAELPLLQGNDAALTATISNGTPGQIQSTLLAKSPYLSDRVLVAAIRKGLPNGTLKNIILPNSPITTYVKTVLDSLSLPNGIRKQINDAQTGISQRAIQEGLLTNLRDEQHSIAIDAMTALLLDSVYRKPEEINKLLLTLGATEPNCQKVKTYLNYNDVVNAQKEADTVMVMLGSASPVCKYLQTMVNVYRDYHTGELGITKDTTALANVIAFSNEHNQYDSRGAASLLELTKVRPYREWIQGKPSTNNARVAKQTDEENALAVIENINFKVYPNPSAGLFYYELNTAENNNNDATLTVIDMLGKVIINGNINASNQKGMIDLSTMPNGIYFITISNSAKQLFSSKLSVVK